MSLMVEQLLNSWFVQNRPLFNRSLEISHPADRDLETISVYIPASLKVRLKVICMQRKVSIQTVLARLIEEWVVAHS